jgi:hypothetical protein
MTSRRGLKSKFAGKIMKQEIQAEFEDVAKELQLQYEMVVANWSEFTRPEFKAIAHSTDVGSGVSVAVEGNDHQKKTWRMLDSEGRKGGKIIVAKVQQTQVVKGKHGPYFARRYMRFQEGYEPKTQPIGQFGGPGERHGRWIRKRVIRQGPIEPRLFTAKISQEFFQEEFRKAAVRGYRRAFRRMTKEGSRETVK